MQLNLADLFENAADHFGVRPPSGKADSPRAKRVVRGESGT